jgi:hypothetical protein
MRPPILREKLKVAFLIPHWLGQHDEFWYRSGTAKIHEFILANAATGAVHPAFDHQALAQAFAKAAGTEESADALPFEDITFNDDRSSIRVRVQDKDYDCQIKPAVACSAGKPVFPKPAIDISFMSPTAKGDAADPNEGVLVSPDTQWGIFTRDNNLWLRNLKSHQDRQLTRDGVKHFGYGTYVGIYEDASIPRERALAAGHHLPPMASYWSRIHTLSLFRTRTNAMSLTILMWRRCPPMEVSGRSCTWFEWPWSAKSRQHWSGSRLTFPAERARA